MIEKQGGQNVGIHHVAWVDLRLSCCVDWVEFRRIRGECSRKKCRRGADDVVAVARGVSSDALFYNQSSAGTA